MKLLLKISVLFLSMCFLFNDESFAQARKRGGAKVLKGGAFSLGIGLSLGSVEQDGLNAAIKTAKSNSLATTGNLNSATEYIVYGAFKLASNSMAIQIRPSYFTQSSQGTGNGGNFNYELNGFTVFPLVRFIPLSNDVIDFYIQGGLGYGQLDGKITNGLRSANFTGSGFGTQAGIGADFCFFPEHCLGIEGSYRYLPIVRNVVSSSGGALLDGISQGSKGKELEDAAGDDVATKLSGISGIVTYTFNF